MNPSGGPLTIYDTPGRKRKLPAFVLARLMAEKEANYHPQLFPSMAAFAAEYNLTGKVVGWRLTDVLLGAIEGIPNSRGFLVATNGNLCYILRSDNSLFQGHMDWFKVDKQDTPFVEPTFDELMDLS